MFSDNGTNFRGTTRELYINFNAAINGPTMVNRLATIQTAWHFIPPPPDKDSELVQESATSTVKCYCWSDSTITLEWLSQSPSRWQTFVVFEENQYSNRVAKIQELGSSIKWNHVPTEDNPADCASRGLTPEEILSHQLWWSGPSWLKLQSSHWPQLPLKEVTETELEKRLSVSVNAINVPVPWDFQHKFPSWSKLLRVTARLLYFIRRIRWRISKDTSPIQFSALDINSARRCWIKRVQAELFPAEIVSLHSQIQVNRSSALSSLVPYLDDYGIIRVRGRLKNADLQESTKHPIILKAHPLINLIIMDTHLKMLHIGPQLTLTRLRQEY